ncbi:hypothetical protein PPYR_12478 [Photinus pyralis]|uniref:SSD domain-containing protein n=1 Tax=Photinus pyralis TaxID=7054 RepID=A0A5N4AEB5_PHOPY|nr:patched domain-containing protein 3 [Photinus pyralis]KAB0795639.1 hypothetical protein PPYR_12478 [Photinus pyralis]
MKRMGLRCLDDFLNRSFYRLGLLVGHHPGYFLIVPVLLFLLCLTGYQRIHYNIDPEYLFSPVNGPGKYERAVVEEHFKLNYTHRFNVARITRAGRFGRVIITSSTRNKNMLRAEVWKEMRTLDDLIQNMTVFYDEEYFTYKDICAKWGNQCFQNDILNLDQIMEKVEAGTLRLTFPIMINPVTWDAHAFPVYFGGTEVSEDSTILSVPSVQLAYFTNVDTKKFDAKGAAWEDGFLDKIEEIQDGGFFKHIRIARFASRTLDHELEKNTRTVIPYFTSTFVIMALFSIVTCMMADWVRSKPWLGLLGNVSACMATVAAFGTCMYLDIDFIGINLAAPFLMIGIGIDDTFVMLAAWRRTSIKDTVPERMAKMLSEAAVSITITSVTDMISFFIGIFNPFPSVRIFCIYSSVATLFTFIFHLTFFTSCMALAGYCEQGNRHSIVCVKVQPVSKSRHRSIFYRLLCTGGVDPNDIDNATDNKEHRLMVFFRDYFAKFLNNSFAKILIITTFLLYLLGAGYGVTQIEEGLERRKVAKSDSYAIEFFDREDDYFREFPYRIQVIVSGELNYSDPVIQKEVEHLTQTFENTSYVSGSLYSESWLRSFLSYVEHNNDYLNITIDNENDFLSALKEHWLYPSSQYALDVKFNKNGTRIQAMRFMIQAVNISGTEHEKEMVQALRQICSESPLNVSVFHPYFVFFDQFELVKPMSIQNMVMGAIIMMVISFLFIPNPLCSLWVAFSIISIETGVVGYMALWKVNLDSISMINLIMCIGFSVDFTAHICYAYMSSSAKHPDKRVQECLYALGLPIFQGAFSTILGMVALLLPNNYLFSVFFKMVFLVVFFGAMHGLFLLPVLLSIFGPGSCTNYDDPDEIKLSSIEKTFPRPYCIPHPQFTLNGSNLGNNLKGHNLSLENKPGGPKVNKAYVDLEKDLGLGTSEENSSESSSNKSNKKNILDEDISAWRRSYNLDLPAQRVLDIFGNDTEKEWRKSRELYESRRRSSDNWRKYQDSYNKSDEERYNRRCTPPQESYYRRPLSRSSSHHNLQHPRYVQELRFP